MCCRNSWHIKIAAGKACQIVWKSSQHLSHSMPKDIYKRGPDYDFVLFFYLFFSSFYLHTSIRGKYQIRQRICGTRCHIKGEATIKIYRDATTENWHNVFSHIVLITSSSSAETTKRKKAKEKIWREQTHKTLEYRY